jgi:serralysin
VRLSRQATVNGHRAASYTQASAVKTYNLTTDARFNALLQADPSYRLAWSTVSGGKTQVTYSFIWGGGVASQFATGYGTEMTAATVGALPSSEYANVALAFQQWANVANITFKQATETAAGGVGDIRLGLSSRVGDPGAIPRSMPAARPTAMAISGSTRSTAMIPMR